MSQRLTDFAKNVSPFWIKVFKDFYGHHGLTRATSLAYTVLLTFVPLSIVVVGIASFFPSLEKLIIEIETFAFTNFVPHTGDVVLIYVEDFETHARQLPWINFIFLGIAAFLMVNNMERQLNHMWQIRRRFNGGIFFCTHWIVLTTGPLLLCISLALSSNLFSDHWLKHPNFKELPVILPFIFSFLAFLFLYYFLPNCKVKLVHAAIGALFATICFEIAKITFVYYTNVVSTYAILYGTLAAIPLFLIWLYVASAVFLLGGQVVNTLRIGKPY